MKGPIPSTNQTKLICKTPGDFLNITTHTANDMSLLPYNLADNVIFSSFLQFSIHRNSNNNYIRQWQDELTLEKSQWVQISNQLCKIAQTCQFNFVFHCHETSNESSIKSKKTCRNSWVNIKRRRVRIFTMRIIHRPRRKVNYYFRLQWK